MTSVEEFEAIVEDLLIKEKHIRELRRLLTIVDDALNRGADFQCGPKGRHSTLKESIKTALAATKKYSAK